MSALLMSLSFQGSERRDHIVATIQGIYAIVQFIKVSSFQISKSVDIMRED